jgi:hypothetical protein
MRADERVETRLYHYTIIAAYWRDKYQSSVIKNRKLVRRFEGNSLQDALQKARDFAAAEYEKTRVTLEYYQNATLLVSFNEGAFRGRVQSGDKVLFHSEPGPTREHVLKDLRSIVEENPAIIHEEFLGRHKSYLTSIGIKADGELTKKSAQHRHRQSHCWACHHPVDNMYQLECSFCGWIICTCGACGCGYKG